MLGAQYHKISISLPKCRRSLCCWPAHYVEGGGGFQASHLGLAVPSLSLDCREGIGRGKPVQKLCQLYSVAVYIIAII